VAGRSTRTAVLAILALVVVPWSVQTFSAGGVSFVFAWGLVTPGPLSVTTIYEYLFVYTVGLPPYILAWPLSVLLWALALASALVGHLTGREDVRVTAALLVFAGLAQVSLARGFALQPYRSAFPLGTVLLWATAWWLYGADLRRSFGREPS
jgi:uncharacterized protein (TIGR04206 family)